MLYGIRAGSWVFWQSTLDIQLHNTYFVISNAAATLPFFVVVALVITGARSIAAPLRTRYTWVVLLVLGLAVLLSVAVIVLITNKIMR